MNQSNGTERSVLALGERRKMRVFISWSGSPSHEYARALAHYLPEIIQSIDPFVSSDITGGSRWGDIIARELATNSYGILCLTEQSKDSHWLLFEAGALSKSFETAHVVPLLFDLEPSQVKDPLAQLQMRHFNVDSMRKLVLDINASCEMPRETGRVDAAFEKWWPDLDKAVTDARSAHHTIVVKPTLDPVTSAIEQILESVRDQRRILSNVVQNNVFSGSFSSIQPSPNIDRKSLEEIIHCVSFISTHIGPPTKVIARCFLRLAKAVVTICKQSEFGVDLNMACMEMLDSVVSVQPEEPIVERLVEKRTPQTHLPETS